MAHQKQALSRAKREALRRGTALAVSLALALSSTPLPARAATEDDLPEAPAAQEVPQEEAVAATSDEATQGAATDSAADPQLTAQQDEEDEGDSILSLAYEPANSKPIIERTHGAVADGEGDGDVYWHYDSYRFQEGDQLSVTYASGTLVYTLSDLEVGEDGEVYGGSFVTDDGASIIYLDEVYVTDNQYESHWGVGTHHYELHLNGYDVTCEIPVEIIANPVDYIDYEPVEPIVLTEGVDGWENDADPDAIWFEYDYPNPRPGDALTVTYADDRGEVRYVCGEDDEGYLVFVNENDPTDEIRWSGDDGLSMLLNQTSEEPWLIGNDNSWVVTYSGRRCYVPVTLVGSSVASIGFEPAAPIVLTAGVEGDGTPEPGMGWSFAYSYAEGDVLVVERADGTTRSYTYDPESACFVWSDGDETDSIVATDEISQQVRPDGEDGPVIELRYCGRTVKVPCVCREWTTTDVQYLCHDVTILAGDVEDAGRHRAGPRDGDELVLTQRLADTDETRTQTYRYGDGSFVNVEDPEDYCSNYEVYGEGYVLDETGTPVWNDSFWELGEGNCWYFSWNYGEKIIEVPVTLEADGVMSISYTLAAPLTFAAHTVGYWEGHWDEDDFVEDYYVYTFYPTVGDQLVVTDDQDNQTTYTYNEGEDVVGAYYADPDDPESAHVDTYEIATSLGVDEGGVEWGPGEHAFELRYRGRATTVPVTITEGEEPDPETACDLEACGRIAFDQESYVYTGDLINPVLHVYAEVDGEEVELTEDEDYLLEYSNNVDAGTVEVTATGMGVYMGSISSSFEIEPADIADAEVEIYDQTYTGEAVEPIPTVTWGDPEIWTSGPYYLEMDKDYTVTYENNDGPGTATATLEGIGNFAGTVEATFTITQPDDDLISIAGAEVHVDDQTYTGEEVTPEVSVIVDGVKLEPGTDYYVEFEDNVEVGVACVLIYGCGAYTGGIEAHFAIKEAEPELISIDDAYISLADTSVTYTGAPHEVRIYSVELGEQVLRAGDDYTVEFRDNVNVGTATVFVTGVGNYTGEATATFAIEPAPLGETVIWDIEQPLYTGEAQQPTITLTDQNTNKQLVEGIDYELVYDGEAVDAGEYQFDVVGRGNYTGSLAEYTQSDYLTFEILPVFLDDEETEVEVTIPDQTYAGEPVVPDFEVKVNGRVLIKDVDYTVDINNNDEPGEAWVRINGEGNYLNYYVTGFTILDPYDGLTHGTDGSCTWYIKDGVLTIKPTSGSTGTLGEYNEFEGYKDEIESVRFEPGVKAGKSLSMKLTDCVNLSEIDFSNLDTSATTDFTCLLSNCEKLTSVDLSGLDLSKATNLSYLLQGCDGLANVIWGTHDLSGVKTMEGCLQECPSLKAIDLSGLTINGSATLTNMFFGTSPESFTVGTTYPLDNIDAVPELPRNYQGAAWRSLETGDSYTREGLAARAGIADTYELSICNLEDADVTLAGCTYNANTNRYNVYYTGESIEPEPTVTLGGKTLTRDVDYTVTYGEDNKTVGLGHVYLTGIGAYEGSLDLFLSINRVNLGGSSVEGLTVEVPESATWDGTSNRNYAGGYTYLPPVTITYRGKNLVLHTDYEIDYDEAIGTNDVTIRGKGNFTGAVTRSFTLEALDMADADVYFWVMQRSNRYEDGEYELPYVGGGRLEPWVGVNGPTGGNVGAGNYKVTYESNCEVGTAYALVEGRNFCTGSRRISFKIVPRDINETNVSQPYQVNTPDDCAYTGEALCPSVYLYQVISGQIKKYEEGKHFTVAYENNVHVGTATATVTGIGGFYGTKTVTFQIVSADLKEATVSLSRTSFGYNGKAQKPTVTVKMGEKTLVEGTDYTLAYSNASSTAAGSYTVTVTGEGNYQGSSSATYKIAQAANPMKAKAAKAKVTVKQAKVKKKAKTLACNVAFTSKSVTGVAYANASSGKVKKWKVNAATGKITVPKKTKKGTYKVKIRVTAKANANYVTPQAQIVAYKVVVK